jgi:hypothetical protein
MEGLEAGTEGIDKAIDSCFRSRTPKLLLEIQTDPVPKDGISGNWGYTVIAEKQN